MGPLIHLSVGGRSAFQSRRVRCTEHLLGRRITVKEGRNRLIEEIGELALQYDMDYFG
jgi:hypothetical protein